MSYLILAQSDVTARALGAWLELLGEPPLQGDVARKGEAPRLDDPRCIVMESLVRNGDQGVAAFETVSDQISKALAEGHSMPITVLVDSVNADQLNPLSEGGGWDSLLALLILAMPEVRWVFGVIRAEPDWKDWHSLAALISKPWRNPLLDATGLRNEVRKLAEKTKAHGVPQRSQQAAAIDEEVHYAIFHAYSAYRFGYRADAVTSWKLMEALFDGDQKDKPHGFDLLLEDVNLYFPDRPARTHLSTFAIYHHEKDGEQGRALHCKTLGYETSNLKKSKFRIIVTSGHSGSSPDTMEKNRLYVKKNNPTGWGFVLKPTGGTFDLWEKARLFERLQPSKKGGEGGSRAGLAPDFFWPPPKSATNDPSADSAHSAPGKLMLVATHLVRRADALRADANTVEECIRGAVLATEAVELLGYRTPTLALQALELKQWFETKAEVAFVGVGHHFQLERRFKEIERETNFAARFHHRGRRDAAALDASVTIANRLTLVFREAGQFDEEEECLRKLRWWNRKLTFRRARNKFYLWPGLGLLAYAEWLISSLGWLLLSVAGWMLLIALAWWALQPADKSWADAVEGVISSFIGSGVVTDAGSPVIFISVFTALLGFFHLGVFVSFLYSAIARK
jgi:hypothetical protein